MKRLRWTLSVRDVQKVARVRGDDLIVQLAQ